MRIWLGTVLRIGVSAACLLVMSAVAYGQAPPITGDDREIEAKLSKMSLSEKLSLLGGHGMETASVQSLSLPALKMSDGPMGLKGSEPAHALPGGLCLASTWNPALAFEMGQTLGLDARARGIDILLGPGVNLVRSPISGRNFEYFSEDPKLTASMAVPYIRGVQQQGVIATVKHLAANNSEFDRHNTNAIVDERTLRELYLPAFEAAVRGGQVGAVMTAYNRVNGEYASQNSFLIRDLLEGEWHFQGIVMSDWGAVYNGVVAAQAGLGLEMPTGQHMNSTTLIPALHGGRLSMAEIDDKVRRLLRTASKVHGKEERELDTTTHIARFRPNAIQLARKIAEQGIVLLKNDGAALPFGKDVKTVAVLGPDAIPLIASGGGSSHVGGWGHESVVEALGKRVKVLYDRGISTPEEIMAHTSFSSGILQYVYPNVNFTGPAETTHLLGLQHATGERASADVGVRRSVRWTADYIAAEAGDYLIVMGTDAHDHCVLTLNGKMPLEALQHEIISPPTWDVRGLPQGNIHVELKCETSLLLPKAGLGIVAIKDVVHPAALAMAKTADAVVIAAGFDNSTEFEGMDRTFDLPLGQTELIRRVGDHNKRTIAALTGGGNVDMSSWLSSASALLQEWYPGEQGGVALTEILLGDVNPSGKLPVSFERALSDNPTSRSYYPSAGSHDVAYREGILLGYRYYETKHVNPRFPFGFGLSYTSFDLRQLQLSTSVTNGRAPVDVRVQIQNTGALHGSEVVQLYVGCHSERVLRAAKELKGFQKVDLAPGENATVRFLINFRDLAYYDVIDHRWKVEDGTCKLWIGTSSHDTPLSAVLQIKQTDPSR